ncbi:unnamed protein product [Spirodela intermedia]|uniref:Protein kinase domain-containing protein n=1 Tax=Spirodela intermedia TaxID=51605 RepID=A0A7I8IV43_SPIIN|nr:unnamed protein product [Spirodela intermedia]CAA6661875.1 unnamed protein product [Spirodela intermedia]
MGCFSHLKTKKEKSQAGASVINEETAKEKLPAKFPRLEEEPRGRSLRSAPSSFKMRPQSSQQFNRAANSRARALSAPSSLDSADQHHLLSVDPEEQEEEHKDQVGSAKDHRFSSSQPLPLPSPPDTSSALKNAGSFSFKLTNSNSLFLQRDRAACQNFSADRRAFDSLSSTAYTASFGDDFGARSLKPPSSGFKEFMAEVNLIASLQHPNLCKLLGFHAREGSDQRMLVYERLCNGSLDRLLRRKSDSPAVDWATRMKIALCAARGLVYLHEEGPFQAMYSDFSSRNIQIERDYTAKLSGHGGVSSKLELDSSSASVAAGWISEETLEKGLLTPKSNVWSFGVVLLELLTGRRHLDQQLPKEERNLVRWSRAFLADDCRLSLIMDPRLKHRFPTTAARVVADAALRCLHKEPSERPTMRAVAESLESVQDVKYCCRFRLHEPATAAAVAAAAAGKPMMKFHSFNSIVAPSPASPPPGEPP